MDGTMIDNMMVHHRAWQIKLSELGLEMSIEEVKEKIHGVNEEILERIFGTRLTAEERKRHAAEKEAAYRDIFLPELKLLYGIQEFLDYLHGQSIPMAIGTAAPSENVEFVIDNLALADYFRGIFHSGHVTRGKPDPQIFELAAESMGLNPDECIIFEDSVTGAEASSRAGSKSIIITTTHAKEEFSRFDNILAFIEGFTAVDCEHRESA